MSLKILSVTAAIDFYNLTGRMADKADGICLITGKKSKWQRSIVLFMQIIKVHNISFYLFR